MPGAVRGMPISTVTYKPGCNVPSVFGTSTSTCIVRLAWTSATALRATVPLNTRPGSSGTRTFASSPSLMPMAPLCGTAICTRTTLSRAKVNSWLLLEPLSALTRLPVSTLRPVMTPSIRGGDVLVALQLRQALHGGVLGGEVGLGDLDLGLRGRAVRLRPARPSLVLSAFCRVSHPRLARVEVRPLVTLSDPRWSACSRWRLPGAAWPESGPAGALACASC